ncbi:LysR family transcriptional regulator [Pseudooceanicola algae]|uniref:PCP degradation transcriptional activation protein n=1 Tax=Pseudooceanicola algae TaxID=1537215 RepID=A0A418SKX9_9RHOB|nr:LysR family transcriptional regulator [Pseudooceanicola algae]QPM90930.1 PCP degradation transcriptional activation protein [Pseudooceanicola algae]
MDNKTLLRFDLNLIKVFLAVWDSGNLTIAAGRLGLTQPAVSHALRRLRDEFGDPLFVRSGNGMAPTQMAASLRSAFEESLRLVADTMQATTQFDPATAARQFRVAMTDTGEFVILPRLLAALQTVAPDVRVRSSRIAPDDIASALRTGQVDAAIGYQPRLPETSCLGWPVMRDRIVCLFRSGHPLEARDWTPDAFSGLSFLDVGQDATGYRMARERIADLGIPYRVVAQVDHFTIVPEIIRRTDFVALFPYSVCALMNRHGEFGFCELPFDVPDFDVNFWIHDSFASDPGLIWLHGLLAQTLQD